MRSAFKDQYPYGILNDSLSVSHPFILEQRKAKAEALRQQHSDRIPVNSNKRLSPPMTNPLNRLSVSGYRLQIFQI